MPTLIEQPARIEAAGNKPKLIEEFVGRVKSGDSAVSIARMRSPSGWVEPGQRPEFDEYTIVLAGSLRVEHEAGQFVKGTDPGAPTVTGFRAKLLWTTLISAVIFAGFYVVYANQLVTLDDLATLWGLLGPHR